MSRLDRLKDWWADWREELAQVFASVGILVAIFATPSMSFGRNVVFSAGLASWFLWTLLRADWIRNREVGHVRRELGGVDELYVETLRRLRKKDDELAEARSRISRLEAELNDEWGPLTLTKPSP